jgi:hypothetical protein
MSDVQSRAARIREHVQYVLLPFRAPDHGAILEYRSTIRRGERIVFLPILLPLTFDLGEWISPPPDRRRLRLRRGRGLVLDRAHVSTRVEGGETTA